jgi:hypothetical protein
LAMRRFREWSRWHTPRSVKFSPKGGPADV